MAERRHYIDNLRSFGVLSVVVFHAFFIFGRYSTRGTVGSFGGVQYQDIAAYLINPWLVSLLFLVSGISSRLFLQSHTLGEYLKQRTLRCLVPSTLGVLTFHFIEGYVGARYISTLTDGISYWKSLLLGVNAMWYLWLLWLFSVCAALFTAAEKGRLYQKTAGLVLSPFIIPVWLCFQILNFDRYFQAHGGGYFAVFMIGFTVLAHDEPADRLARFWYIPTAAAAVFGKWYLVRFFGCDYLSSEVFCSILTVAYGYFSCLALFGIFKRYFDRETAFSSLLKRYGFGIYVFHYLPLSLSAYLLFRSTAIAPALCYLTSLFSALSGSVFLTSVVSKIPLLRFCTLGMVKRRINNDN